MWQKDVAEYFKTCDRCQKANKSTGKRVGNMIKIQEPSRPWEIVHMALVTGLPPGGDRSYNACLVIVDIFSKTPIFPPFYKDDKAMDTALLIWNRVISCTGIYTNIISDRDPKFPSALRKNLHQLFAKKLSFSTAYHPQTDELEYKTSIHASTNQTPAVLEKGWDPRLPQDYLRKNLALNGENSGKVELSEELSNKHPTFPVSLIKAYKSGDAENFPLRNKVPQNIPPAESPITKKITKVPKERKLRSKKVKEYLVRYSEPNFEDELLAETGIPEATKLLRRFRHTGNNNIKK
ncbi:hypothetical protein O181_107127 [Austropuccinia psidii MF-1]|uniref:Integrase catalytic domain-containing protein n=1 Tax=Austropuccinia psidii MF-1 TaxID=1389203 RepID=A0A9Q3PP19_9BASI|nr:hypothetical protein [Austropuccinia psidii MF-1]